MSTNAYLSKRLVDPVIVAACMSYHVRFVLVMIVRLGFIPNWVNSKLKSAQIFTYLGVVFDLVQGSVRQHPQFRDISWGI